MIVLPMGSDLLNNRDLRRQFLADQSLTAKDVHQAGSDLNDINVAGDRVSYRERERNIEVEILSVMLDTPARPYPESLEN